MSDCDLSNQNFTVATLTNEQAYSCDHKNQYFTLTMLGGGGHQIHVLHNSSSSVEPHESHVYVVIKHAIEANCSRILTFCCNTCVKIPSSQPRHLCHFIIRRHLCPSQ